MTPAGSDPGSDDRPPAGARAPAPAASSPRVSDLFHQAVTRPPAERAAFLDAACGSDRGLRQEVESLLGYDAALPDFLEAPASALAARAGIGPGTLAPGERLGQYQVVALLAAGGMGEVYRARDARLGREVALKVLPARFTGDPERRSRFAREARLLATLNHPNIGAIYGVEETATRTAIVLELVEGPTLATAVARGPLPIARALATARGIAAALDAAHARGIVHRDLKPANVVVQPAGDGGDTRVTVLDFGLAKWVAGEADAAPDRESSAPPTTEEGRLLGTPAYMSPEQARGRRVDRRSDIWAFGCVLFELLAGRPAFAGETSTDVFVRILEHEPPWDALPTTTPAGIRRLLRRCLEKDPARRLRDIGDALIDLEEADPDEGPPRWRRASRAWMLGALALTLVSAGAGWLLRGRPPAIADPIPAMRIDMDLGADVTLVADVRERGGHDRLVAISPAGDRLVFLSGGRLFVRSLGHTQATPLAGTEDASSFFLSADGRSVAFVAGGVLKRVSVDGGPVTTISERVPPVRGGSWNGSTIVLGGTGLLGGLLRVPDTGGTPEPLSRLAAGEFTHRWPQILPDGDTVLFTAHRSPGWFETASLHAVSLRDGHRQPVLERATFGRFTPGTGGIGALAFIRNGRLFSVPFDPIALQLRGEPLPVIDSIEYERNFGSAQFDVSASGTLVYRPRTDRTLRWIDPSGARRTLPLEGGRHSGLSLSPDASHVIFLTGSDLWVYDLRREVRTLVATGVLGSPTWTPDAKFLVYATADAIMAVPTEGSAAPQPLLPPKPSVVRLPTSIRRDGLLGFAEIRVGGGGGWDIWTAPLRIEDGTVRAGPPTPLLATPHDERAVRFSPDGRWIAYISNEGGDLHDVYVRPFPDDGRRWRVSEGGGVAPRWSSGRPELFFARDRTIMVVSYDTTGGRFAPGKPRAWSSQPIATDADAMFTLAPDGLHVLGLVADPAAEARAQHVVTLWTHALAGVRARQP